jgi:signal transduction histidine kinase
MGQREVLGITQKADSNDLKLSMSKMSFHSQNQLPFLSSKRKPVILPSRAPQDYLLKALAHDLRSPLASIIQLTELLEVQMEQRIRPEEKEYLNFIRRACENSNELLEHLLHDLKTQSSGEKAMEVQALNFAALLEEVVDCHRPAFEQKEITVEVYLASSVVLLEGDRVKLRQVMNNLLSNALKFTNPGGQVCVILTERAGEVECQVEDTGVGIPAHLQERLFEEFTPTGREGTQGEGSTGLGLSIVKRIIEMHRGSMTVDSTVGKGSIFTFRLPR